jgi:hypothetical protein
MNIFKKDGKTIGGFLNIEGILTIKNCTFNDCDGVEDLFAIAIRGSEQTAREEK